MKTLKGIETYGSFSLGSEETFAKILYNSLEGDPEISTAALISIDLIKREQGIPFPLELKHCSYEQLAANVKQITKELFKHLNLET